MVVDEDLLLSTLVLEAECDSLGRKCVEKCGTSFTGTVDILGQARGECLLLHFTLTMLLHMYTRTTFFVQQMLADYRTVVAGAVDGCALRQHCTPG